MPTKPALVPAVFCLLLCTCTTTSEVKPIEETLQPGYIPLQEERWAIRQADLYYREFDEQGLLYRDIPAVAWLERVEKRLLADQEPLQEGIRLYFFKAPLPNAFAWPNGNIYLHAGLLTTIESEAQLAAIAAHEIAHITERHSIKAVIANKNKLIGSHIADFATGGFGLVYFGTFASIMHYSREQESEADSVGLDLLTQAGYPAAAMLEAFETLQRYPELKHHKQSIYSSHPSFQDRMENLQSKVVANTTPAGGALAMTEEFSVLKARMMEDSLKTLLRNRDFNTALIIVDEAESYFGDDGKISFYRGEVYHGFYKYPEIAAREYHFIETGKEKPDQATLDRFEKEKGTNLEQAKQEYSDAVSADPPHPRAYRRLGEIAEAMGEEESARSHYLRYLELQPEAVDRNYVERALGRLDPESEDQT